MSLSRTCRALSIGLLLILAGNSPAQECGPDATGLHCLTAPCSGDEQRCVATCARFGPNQNLTEIIRCDCRGPEECHIELTPGTVPHCAGPCPASQRCQETRTFDEATGELILCCDCITDTDGGACCLPDGGCIQTTPAGCEERGGGYLGDGSICSGITVPCCLPPAMGGCTETDITCCQIFGGVPLTFAEGCKKPEACCFESGECRELDPNCCIVFGGRPLGAGTTCLGDANGDGADDACLPPPHDCGPDPDGPGCRPVECPSLGDRCVPTCVRLGPNQNLIETLNCACRSPDECHVVITATAPPHCQGGCPPGETCFELRTIDPATGTITLCCGCSAIDLTGACCLENGDCVQATAFDCKQHGGSYLGDGSQCAGVTAGCCMEDGTCRDMDPVCCRFIGGQPNTAGCRTTEACCFDGGGCRDMDPTCCLMRGGAPQGPGTACRGDANGNGRDDACELPPPDCGPDSTGFGCLPTECPDPAHKCLSKCIRLNAAGQFVGSDCQCRDPNECHFELVPGTQGPQCMGSCPDGTPCLSITRVNEDGSIEICCDCQPTVGACCLEDGNCVQATAADCQDRSGSYLGNGSACGGVVVGCCLEDGTCRDMDVACCHASGGQPNTLGCRPAEACCFENGGCRDIDPICCLMRGGAPQGAGTACQGDANGNGRDDACEPPPPECGPNPNGPGCSPTLCPIPEDKCLARCVRIGPNNLHISVDCECRHSSQCHVEFDTASLPHCVGDCPEGTACVRREIIDAAGNIEGFCCDCVPLTGSCCLADGTCVLTTAAGCEERGGRYLGDGSACGGVVVGCCLEDGTCRDMDLACCHASGGQPNTAGCRPPEACCIEGGGCRDLDPTCCRMRGGLPQGPGTACQGDANGNGRDDACEPPPPECGPNSNGPGCLPVECPDPSTRCVAKCLRIGPNGQFLGADCECRNPEECHFEFPAGSNAPECVGVCPDGTACQIVTVSHDDGTVELCCTCVPLNGACCLEDGHCVHATAADCQERGGRFLGDGSTCGGVVVGCCLQDGTCRDMDVACCRAAGGQPNTAGCRPPEACCFTDGNCRDMEPTCCRIRGGVPQGPGTACQGDANGNGRDDACEPPPPECGPSPLGLACLPVECPDATQRCMPRCVGIGPNGQLMALDCECRSADDCHMEFVGSTFPQCVGNCPEGTECERVPTRDSAGNIIGFCCECVPVTGACCLDDGTCIRSTAADCRGHYLGDGTRCSGITVACCLPLPDGRCIDADMACCQAMGGTPSASGSRCEPPRGCCFEDGRCLDLDPNCCHAFGGIPQPTGSACRGDADGDGQDDLCQPPTDECGPDSTGQHCSETACPALNERCSPRCVRLGPNGQFVRITDCDCRSSDECHVVVTASGGAGCAGRCPPQHYCNQSAIRFSDGSSRICCDCNQCCLGDLDGDGVVTNHDWRWYRQCLRSGSSTNLAVHCECADFNGNGVIDDGDTAPMKDAVKRHKQCDVIGPNP